MLQAILHGKAGRVSVDGVPDRSWREIFRVREDLLTATFFGRISYLSQEGQQEVLSLLAAPNEQTDFDGIEEVLFWPRLQTVSSQGYVEPDVLIQCESIYFLIEVKPPFGGQQSVLQWENQIASLVRKIDEERDNYNVPEKIYFLALGNAIGNWQQEAAKLECKYDKYGLVIISLEWFDLSRGVEHLLDKAEGCDRVIYSDWLEAFALFGLTIQPLPFSDLSPFLVSDLEGWRLFFQE